MPKSYLRYAPAGVFNVVASPLANITFITLRNQKGKFCAVAACEDVIIWDIKKGQKIDVLKGDKHEVTCLVLSPNKRHLAVGYTDGSIRVFDLIAGELKTTFKGHKKGVTCLNFDRNGMRLTSGAKDTELIVWDIVNESGLYRLKGHKDAITSCFFMKKRNILISSSKDTLLKFWDLDTQHCFKTVIGHVSEVWAMILLKNDTRLITGSSHAELSIWDIKYIDEEENKFDINGEKDNEVSEDTEDELKILHCIKAGTITRQNVDRVISLAVDPTESVLGVHGSGKYLEIFRLRTDGEARQHLQKRQKKARRKLRQQTEESAIPEEVPQTVSIRDEIERLDVIKLSGKPRAFDIYIEDNNPKIVVLLNNNMIELITSLNGKSMETSQLSLPGHRSIVRDVCFSSDNTAIMSISHESVKIWNRSSLYCIRTMTCIDAQSCFFVPGDRHCIVGNKKGTLQIFDIASSAMLEEVQAHDSTIYSICLHPLLQGFASGGEDTLVKFWDFELILDKSFSETSKRLSIIHTRTLQMSEPILKICFSPDQRLVAVALLDCTVKVFFNDTLKFFLSMYGHKLPVRCMDISSDSTLIITGSDDRNIKIWGLDFGDCHKSIFAHDNSVTSLQFIPKTHMFFSVGKDKKLKQWDADNFEKVITLEGHHADILAVAISPSGNFVASAANDKSIRLWEKTQEPLVLEDEGEMEREAEFEQSLEQGDNPVIAGESTTAEAGLAGKRSIETIKGAEKLMEAIEVYRREMVKNEAITVYKSEMLELEDEPKTSKNLEVGQVDPLILAYGNISPIKFVLTILKQIKSSELEESLLVLPFSYVMDFFDILNSFLELQWDIELTTRCIFFLLRIHHGQITANQSFVTIISKLRINCAKKVQQLRDDVGVNLAGLQFLKKEIEMDETTFFLDATNKLEAKKKKTKRRAILSLNL